MASDEVRRLQQGEAEARESQSSETHHIAHLESNALQPSLDSFHLRNHVRKFLPYDSLSEQGFAKDVSLSGPLEAFLDDHTGRSG